MGQSSRQGLTKRFSNDSPELHFSLPAYQVMHKKTTSPTKKRTVKKINLLLSYSLISRADNRGKSVTYHNALCHKTIKCNCLNFISCFSPISTFFKCFIYFQLHPCHRRKPFHLEHQEESCTCKLTTNFKE